MPELTEALAGVAALAWQVLVCVAITPLLIGITRQTRARLEGRAGAGIGQPARDLRKLLAKEPITVAGAGVWTGVLPLVLLISSLVLVTLVPLVTTAGLSLVPGDLFVVVSVLLIGTVALAAMGLHAGTAFGGMGASRHMTVAALVEPTVLVAVYALSVPTSSTALADLVTARLLDPALAIAPVSLLALVALGIVVVAETGRLPVDNPSTHLELTMIHEAMILEHAGRDLAWIELGSWLRMTALLGLLVNLIAPFGISADLGSGLSSGISSGLDPGLGAGLLGLLLAAIVLAAKLSLAAALIGGVEVFLAKLRLFRIPELLAGSFVLAFLAVTASYLLV